MEIYSTAEIAEMVTQAGRATTPQAVAKFCSRKGIGVIKARVRLVEKADVPALIAAMLVSRPGNPEFGPDQPEKYRQSPGPRPKKATDSL